MQFRLHLLAHWGEDEPSVAAAELAEQLREIAQRIESHETEHGYVLYAVGDAQRYGYKDGSTLEKHTVPTEPKALSHKSQEVNR